MRSLVSAGAGLAFAAAVLASPAVLAGEEERRADAEPAGVAWIEGWDLGREKAAHTDRLMLVYVYRTSPH